MLDDEYDGELMRKKSGHGQLEETRPRKRGRARERERERESE